MASNDFALSFVALQEAVALHALLENCSKSVNIQAFRNGEACSPNDPGLGTFIVESVVAIDRHVSNLRQQQAHLDDLLLRAENQRQLNIAFTSAVRRFPYEILADIFLLAAALGKPAAPKCLGHSYNFAFVCHRWREIALGTSDLWTDMWLWSRDLSFTHDLIARELRLSGERPLDVRVSQQCPGMIEAYGPTKTWELLQKQSHRWRTLTLELDAWPLWMTTSEPMIFSSLVALHLKHTHLEPEPMDGYSHDGPRLLLSPFAHAPVLRSISITVGHVGGGQSDLCFPASLTLSGFALDFNLCDGSAARFIPILQQNADTLRGLSLSQTIKSQPLPPGFPVIAMPQLTELTCRLDAAEMISNIDAPQLSSLTVEGLSGHAEDLSGDGLPSVGRRIGMYKHLTSLTVSNVTWATSSLLPTLHILPRLTYLKLEEDTPGALITKSLLEALTRGEAEVDGKITSRNLLCPLPNLAHMHLALQAAGFDDRELAPAVRKMGLSRAATKPQPLVAFCSQYKLHLFPKATSDILVFGIEK
ncbi:hypothetical protein K525DRAFT_272787 [Schizophyllum commune Loenen D]|nr:hypothetical protein K525DRAFT_272787 [Schizophyllum commune Loenen D]